MTVLLLPCLQIQQAGMSTPAAENGPEDVNNRSFWMVSVELQDFRDFQEFLP